MYSYLAYGLKIQSSIALPEFLSAPEALEDADPDLVIRTATEDVLPEEATKVWHFKIECDEAIIHHEKAGIFWIRDGKEVIIVFKPDTEESHTRLYLVGTIMGIVLYQKGLLVLHASAIEVEGQAVAFSANSGCGKSSTAAAFQTFGHRFLTDDVLGIDLTDDVPTVFPAFPQLKLASEVAEVLGHEKESLFVLDSHEEKKGLRVTNKFMHTPLPLKCIYLLTKSDSINIETVSAHEALMELIRQTLPTRWLSPGGTLHFQQSTELTKRVPIYRLNRSDDLSSIKDIVTVVKQHLSEF
jgi:hypothetical protein